MLTDESTVPVDGQREVRVEITLTVLPCGRVWADLRLASHRLDITDETTERIARLRPVVSEHVLALAHAVGEALGGTLMLVSSTTTEPNTDPEPLPMFGGRTTHA